MKSEILKYKDNIKEAQKKIEKWRPLVAEDEARLARLQSTYIIGDKAVEWDIATTKTSLRMGREIIEGQLNLIEIWQDSINRVATKVRRDREMSECLREAGLVKTDGN